MPGMRTARPFLLAAATACALAATAHADAAPPGRADDKGSLKLPGVDLSGLDEGQIRWCRELLEEYPSPCGKPHSLYKSITTDAACKRAPFAAREIVTLLKAGLMKSEVEEHYEERFVHPETAQCRVGDAPLRGKASSKVALIEFSDFQCPHCKHVEPILAKLLKDYDGRVKLYFMNYPIEKLHPDAAPAAAAAMAAGKQGKFWEMHDLLFDHQEQLSPADLEKYAGQLKLDLKRWRTDLAEARARVAKDHAEGERLDISGTPTIYINGRKYKGPLRYEDVKDWVDEELAK
jgi:predicted DsbA family dithiol-disulfide isomerase